MVPRSLLVFFKLRVFLSSQSVLIKQANIDVCTKIDIRSTSVIIGFTSLIDLPNALKPVSILGFYSCEGKYLVTKVKENQRFKRAGATPSFMMYVCVWV